MTPPTRSRTALVFTLALFATLGMRSATPVTIWLAGDSTMARKEENKRPETGWGEALQPCFDSTQTRVANRAMNGRSTRSFVAEGRWKAIVDSLNAGDYVLIEFGHNDEKVNMPVGSSPADFGANLARFVDDVRARRATPVLLTPVARRRWQDGKLVDTHGEYPGVVRAVATEKKVALVDMTELSARVLERYGPDSSTALFLHLKAGDHPNYPAGVEDNTHFSPVGAREMAAVFLDAFARMDAGLRARLKSCPARP
jgi:lysophospholipase L1-like esterase